MLTLKKLSLPVPTASTTTQAPVQTPEQATSSLPVFTPVDVSSGDSAAIGFQLKQKCDELSQMILAKHPLMPELLREIHKTLRAYPEQVTLLEPEEVNKIIEGLKIQTGIHFSTTSGKTGSAATKSVKNKIAALGVSAF